MQTGPILVYATLIHRTVHVTIIAVDSWVCFLHRGDKDKWRKRSLVAEARAASKRRCIVTSSTLNHTIQHNEISLTKGPGCKIGLKDVRQSVLDTLHNLQKAVVALREYPMDGPDRWRLGKKWGDLSGGTVDLLKREIPKQAREALLSEDDITRNTRGVVFRLRSAKGVKNLSAKFQKDIEEAGGWEHYEFFVFLWETLYKHSKVASLDEYLMDGMWKHEWPDLPAAIKKAEAVFDDFKKRGVLDFRPTVEGIKEIILHVLDASNTGSRIRADSELDPFCRTMLLIEAPYTPSQGICKHRMVEVVQTIEPAADPVGIREALYYLERELLIRSVELPVVDIVPCQGGEPGVVEDVERSVPCWVLAEPERQPSGASRKRKKATRFRAPQNRQKELTDIRETRIAEAIEELKHIGLNITSMAVTEKTGYEPSTVRNSEAWKDWRKRLKKGDGVRPPSRAFEQLGAEHRPATQEERESIPNEVARNMGEGD